MSKPKSAELSVDAILISSEKREYRAKMVIKI